MLIGLWKKLSYGLKRHIGALGVFLIALGAALVVYAHVFPSHPYADLFSHFGTAIFSGGVFSVLFKGLQAAGIFKDELAKVLYFDVDYLTNNENLEDFWRSATKALHKNPFPDLEGQISDAISEIYLPANHEYYLEGLRRIQNIDWYDRSNSLIQARVTITGLIVPSTKKRKITFTARVTTTIIDNLQCEPFSLNELRIGEQDFSHINPSQKVENGQRKYRLSQQISIREKVEYTLEYVYIQSLKADNVLNYVSDRYINDLTVDIHYPAESLRVVFNAYGTTRPFQDIITKPPSGTIRKRHRDLLFPNQGFILVISEESKPI